jgi:hypothetical protein
MVEQLESWSYLKTINLKKFRKIMLERKLEYKIPMLHLIDQFKAEENGVMAERFVDVVEMMEFSHRSHVIEEDRLLMLVSALHEGLLFYESELIRLTERILVLDNKVEKRL